MTRLAKSSFSVGATTLASRVLGLIRDVLVASILGAGGSADAFFVAFKIPNLLRRFVAEGSLSAAFVPVFEENRANSDELAKTGLREGVSFVLCLTIPMVLLGIIFAEEIVGAFAPGFTGERSELCAELTQITFGFVAIISLTALLSSALNSLGKFAIPASPPIFLNLALIGTVLIGYQQIEHALSWAVVVGGAFGLLPQIILLCKLGYSPLPALRLKTKTVGNLVKLMIPAVLSASLYQLAVFINTILASLLAPGTVSWLYYADRLFQFPLGVFTIAVATAALPRLSKLAANQDLEKLRLQAKEILSWVFLITLPASLGLIVLAEEIVQLVYLRGEFSQADVKFTSQTLQAFAVGLSAISLQTIATRLFIATKDAKTPAYVTAGALFFNTLLGVTLMGPPEQESFLSTFQPVLYDLDHIGLALASSISSLIATSLLILIARKRALLPSLKLFLPDLLKTVAAAATMTVLLISLDIYVIFDCAIGLLSYAAACWVLNPLNIRSFVLKRG